MTRELHLLHPIRTTRGENLGVLRETEQQSWSREGTDWVVRVKGEEYVLPQTSVKFERRERPPAKSSGK